MTGTRENAEAAAASVASESRERSVYRGLRLILAIATLVSVVSLAPHDARPASAAAGSNTLNAGERLTPGQSLRSSDGRFKFVLQGDGNLVLYLSGRALWSSNTVGSHADRLVMQGDGNLVMYRGSSAVWHSRTAGRNGSRLVVQNDGNVVIYQGSTARWWTDTCCHPAALTVDCWGDWCSGRDPEQTGCGRDAVTTAWKDLTAARLELRWSPTCKTNWARYIQYPRGWFIGNIPLELRAVQDSGYTQGRSYGINGTGEGTTWTPMIYSPVRLVRAELVVQCGGVGDCAQGALTGQNPIVTGWA